MCQCGNFISALLAYTHAQMHQLQMLWCTWFFLQGIAVELGFCSVDVMLFYRRDNCCVDVDVLATAKAWPSNDNCSGSQHALLLLNKPE